MTDRVQLSREWIVLAQTDWAMAQRALTVAPPLYGQACFHFQQAAEKALKGFLTYHNMIFERTHSIARLCTLATAADPAFESVMERFDRLTDFAVGFRYPGLEIPSLSEAKDAMATAEDVMRFVVKRLPSECNPESGLNRV